MQKGDLKEVWGADINQQEDIKTSNTSKIPSFFLGKRNGKLADDVSKLANI